MAQYSTSEFEKALSKKGFEEDKTHHKMFWYYWKGKKTDIRTRTSHNEKQFDDNMLNQRKAQLRLSKKQQIIDFIKCPMSKEDYSNFLIAIGEIEEKEEEN